MAYIGKVPANAPLTSSDIADGIISTADLANTAVTGAKVNADVISSQTALAAEPADTDEFLVSDAGVIKRIDYSLIKGGGGLILISTQNITSNSASVDFTSGIDSTYDTYKLIVSDLKSDTDNVEVKIRIGGGSFENNNYQRATIAREADGNTTTGNGSGNGVNGIFLTNQNAGFQSDEGLSFEAVLNKPSATDTHKIVYGTAGIMDRDGFFNCMMFGGTHINSVTAITRIQVITSSGNISRGRFTLFGVANS